MESYDIAVIGAGPAGMTAALYASRAGHRVALFETLMPGGQMGDTPRVDNYPGFAEGTDGFDLAMAFKQQIDALDIVQVNEQVVALEAGEGAHVLRTAAGTAYQARAVIVASGVRTRELSVPGADELKGRGVSYCATCDGNFFKGMPVMVVGAGNAAVSAAVYLANICQTVYVVFARESLSAKSDKLAQLAKFDNVVLVPHASVRELLEADGKVAGAVVADVASGQASEYQVSAVFGAAGRVPNTEFVAGVLELDDAGFIVSNEEGTTNVAGVFAAGDVRVKRLRQIATAVGDGANAAESAGEYLSGL